MMNNEKKLIALLISITFLTLPACSKSNIDQITGTAAEQSKSAKHIVEEGKKEKENTYLSKIKSCWGWTCQNKKYIAGGAVAVVAIGLIAWWRATREPPQPEAPQVNNELIVDPNANNQPAGIAIPQLSSTIEKIEDMEWLTDMQSDDDDVDFQMFRAAGDRRLAVASEGSKRCWLVLVAPESEALLYKIWEKRMKSPLGEGHRHELSENDRMFLYGQQNKGRYCYGIDNHWWQIIYDDKEMLPLNQDLSAPPVLEDKHE
jgi:hypothetical protein